MQKGQIQMFETIVVLLIFFVFISIGLIFYFKESKSGIDHLVDNAQSLGAIEASLIAMNSPEFVCTSGEYIKSTCFDLQKILAFNSLRLMGINYFPEYYFKLFGYANITVTILYPAPALTYTLYSIVPTTVNAARTFSVPIGVQDSMEDKMYLGVLKVVVMQ